MTGWRKRQVLEMAREAWAEAGEAWVVDGWFDDRSKAFEAFAKLVREDALAQPAPVQEPVAWEQFYPDIGKPQIAFNAEVVGYVAPQRTWVGLTDGDMAEIYNQKDWDIHINWDYERAIEAKLKEKNT